MRSIRILLLSIALLLCLELVTARHLVAARQDNSPSTTQVSSNKPSATPSKDISVTEAPSTTEESVKASQTKDAASSAPATTVAMQVPATTTSPELIPSATSKSADGLPIKPKITPAMGLTGVILLISGAVYTVIGIKNKWLYVFCSAAYLTSLSVSVLIVYLMSPPVTNAVQGAFFVAAILTGLIFGSLALVFADITDGLGCLLGGFCLSMWFLTLKSGGLITSSTGRAIFIGVMSFAGFSLSFSHYTRNYGLIVSTSFAGATITILGIDCLSCAGWKEFWLYIWNLNPNTFPLNTNTYPITRGIKVEVACVVIVTVLGLVSQLRLWKVVKERREKNAAQRLERDQNQQREEEELGRRIEDDFTRERAQWEATYGDKSLQHDSAVESSAGSLQKSSVSIREKQVYDSVEMVNLQPATGLKRDGSTVSRAHATPTGPTVTVTVLQDDNIQEIDSDGNPVDQKEPIAIGTTDGSRSVSPFAEAAPSQAVGRSVSTRNSLRASVPPPPVVVPLPFTVPQEEDEEDADNASVSAVPESVHSTNTKSRPLSNRLSGGSLLKRMSQRLSRNHSDSEEALIIPHVEDDRASSVAATLDDDHQDVYSLPDLTPPHSPLAAEHSPEAHQAGPSEEPTGQVESIPASDSGSQSPKNEIATEGSPSTSTEPAKVQQSLTSSTDPKPLPAPPRRSPSLKGSEIAVPTTQSPQAKSNRSETLSQSSRAEARPEGLAGALPDKLSKVALSYRTNEWAKHLELADRPDVDEIPEPESPGVKVGHQVEEPVGSVRDSLPSQIAKGKTKRASTESLVYRNSNLIRSSSDITKYSNAEALHALSRSPSVLTRTGPPVPTTAFPLQNRTMRSSSTPHTASSYLQSPAEEPLPSRISAVPSPIPTGNTLMSQREQLVRNKPSSHSFSPQSSSPNLLGNVEAENLTLAQRKNLIQKQKPPSSSQQWKQAGWAAATPQPQIYDSHQPRRTSAGYEQERREVMLANWRESIRHEAAPVQTVTVDEQSRRAAMINERRQKEMHKQQQAMAAQQRDSMVDSMMRSGQMLDAHREAMRRMQAKANKSAK